MLLGLLWFILRNVQRWITLVNHMVKMAVIVCLDILQDCLPSNAQQSENVDSVTDEWWLQPFFVYGCATVSACFMYNVGTSYACLLQCLCPSACAIWFLSHLVSIETQCHIQSLFVIFVACTATFDCKPYMHVLSFWCQSMQFKQSNKDAS